MARDSRRRNQSSNLGQTSKISHDKDQAEVSSSLHKQILTPLGEAVEELKKAFNHGHPTFNDMAIAMMQLHSEKNKAYAGGGTPLGNFDRNARTLQNYPTFPYHTPEGFLMMLVMKHVDAILWSLNTGRRPPEDACADISVYMTILRCMGTAPKGDDE